MSLEEIFDKEIKSWEKYCRNPQIGTSSSGEWIRRCLAYENIREMGEKALPFIMDFYSKKPGKSYEEILIALYGLPHLIKEITGSKEFRISGDCLGNIKRTEDYCRQWLRDYLDD